MLKALTSKLLSIAALTALIGEKLYAVGNVPAGTPHPYVTMQVLTGNPDIHNGGLAGNTRELVQIDIYADKLENADAVKLIIEDEIGAVGGETWGGYEIHCCALDSYQNASEIESEGSGESEARTTLTLSVNRNRKPTT